MEPEEALNKGYPPGIQSPYTHFFFIRSRGRICAFRCYIMGETFCVDTTSNFVFDKIYDELDIEGADIHREWQQINGF